MWQVIFTDDGYYTHCYEVASKKEAVVNPKWWNELTKETIFTHAWKIIDHRAKTVEFCTVGFVTYGDLYGKVQDQRYHITIKDVKYYTNGLKLKRFKQVFTVR